MRIAIVIALIAAPMAALAQQRPDTTLRAQARAIVGIVVDTSDNILDSAEVFLAKLRKSTAADTAGRFRFDDVRPGEYEVAARRLGYYPQTRTVFVTRDSGAIVRFVLVPHVRGLTPVVSSAPRGGLSGIVSDANLVPIRDAQIAEVSGTPFADSDSTGRFSLPLRPGRHMLRIRREGYASQLISMNIPRDSGRELMVFLRPSARGESVREENAIFDLNTRLSRRNAVYSSFLTREDISKGPWTELHQMAASHANGIMQPNCLAWVDGGPRQEFLWAIRASEIEALEVYRPRRARPPTSIMVRGGARRLDTRPITDPIGGSDCGGNSVYVWLKK